MRIDSAYKSVLAKGCNAAFLANKGYVKESYVDFWGGKVIDQVRVFAETGALAVLRMPQA